MSKIPRPFTGGRWRGIEWAHLRATWQYSVLLAYYDLKDHQKIMMFSRGRGNIVSGFRVEAFQESRVHCLRVLIVRSVFRFCPPMYRKCHFVLMPRFSRRSVFYYKHGFKGLRVLGVGFSA